MSLNERQKAFCEYYASCLNATEAAKKAGYSEKTAYSSGQRLLKHVEVQRYVKEHVSKAHSERIATANEVLEYLTETMRNEEETRRERTKAAELLGKRFALFIDRQEAEHDNGIQVNVVIESCKGGKHE